MSEFYAAAVLLAAYFIRGIAGFGSGLVAVPLLALRFPLQQVVPLMLLLDLAASTWLGRVHRQEVRWDEIRPLIPASTLGVILGTTLLVGLPARPVLTALSLFVLVFGIRYALRIHGDRPVSRRWAHPAGLLGATVSGLFGTGGPPYVIYLTHRLHDKGQLRATLSVLFMLEGAFRGVVFLAAGLLADRQVWLGFALGLPILFAGLWLGSHVHLRLDQGQMVRVVGLVLLGAGLSLLAKAWS
ncbi:MAG TPA: sulfite exporter TauE/SafE family protein [Thiobacillaceae bacterium]|nr:sulfite exporter TauE/SafE family protein [Thiobacillaceae bacterium]